MSEFKEETSLNCDDDIYSSNKSPCLNLEPITLNVGGTKYCTTLSTLCKDENSMLAKMFGGTFSTKPSKDGSYFIDRNGKYFEYILDFLRDGILIIPDSADRKYIINKLLMESNFYNFNALDTTLIAYKVEIESNFLTAKKVLQIRKWLNKSTKYPHWTLLYKFGTIPYKGYDIDHFCKGYSSLLYIMKISYTNEVIGIYSKALYGTPKISHSDNFVFHTTIFADSSIEMVMSDDNNQWTAGYNGQYAGYGRPAWDCKLVVGWKHHAMGIQWDKTNTFHGAMANCGKKLGIFNQKGGKNGDKINVKLSQCYDLTNLEAFHISY
eukprot:8786_1